MGTELKMAAEFAVGIIVVAVLAVEAEAAQGIGIGEATERVNALDFNLADGVGGCML